MRTRFEDKFQRKFRVQCAMKSVEWKTYRTRFLVKAKQLNSSLTFTDPLGRQHCGRKGDYLVESCDGVLSITPRRIFEDIYVPMGLASDPYPRPSKEAERPESITRDNLRLASLRIQPLRSEKIEANFRDGAFTNIAFDKNARTQRKTPQPVRATPPFRQDTVCDVKLRPENRARDIVLCGKPVLNPASSPSLLVIQPIVFLS